MDCVVASLIAIWVLERINFLDIKSLWLWDLQIVKLLSSVDESKTVINCRNSVRKHSHSYDIRSEHSFLYISNLINL